MATTFLKIQRSGYAVLVFVLVAAMFGVPSVGAESGAGNNKAIDKLLKQAEAGDASAQALLASIYRRGFPVKSDLEKALKWARLSAEADNPLGIYNFARLCESGQGVETDSGKAKKLYRKAYPGLRELAEKGDAEAQYVLGLMTEYGDGVEVDIGAGFAWYLRAAKSGHVPAQFTVGRMYAAGRGVGRSDSRAVRWYRVAAKAGYVWAQANLGVMYDTGRGVKADAQEALHWYELAAEQGNSVAQFNLGRAFETGKGAEKNLAKAYEWYLKAATKGDRDAQNNLAAMCASGQGTEKNLEEASKWFRQAALQGDVTAAANLKKLFFAFHCGVPFASFSADEISLPQSGGWSEAPLKANPAYRLRYRVLLSGAELAKNRVVDLVDINTEGDRLLVKVKGGDYNGEKLAMLDFPNEAAYISSLSGLTVNGRLPGCGFWRDRAILLSMGGAGMLAVSLKYDREGVPRYESVEVIGLKLGVKDAAGMAVDKNWLRLCPGKSQVAVRMLGEDKSCLCLLSQIIEKDKTFFKGVAQPGLFLDGGLPLSSLSEKERYLQREMLKQDLKLSDDLSGADLNAAGAFVAGNPVRGGAGLFADVLRDDRVRLWTYIRKYPASSAGSFARPEVLGRVYGEVVSDGIRCSRGGTYALCGDDLLLDLKRSGPQSSVLAVSLATEAYCGFSGGVFLADDEKRFIALARKAEGGADLVEVQMPESMDDFLALAGAFPHRWADTEMDEESIFQSELALQAFTSFAKINPDAAGLEFMIKKLLADREIWKGRETFRQRILGQWAELENIDDALRAQLLVRRGMLLLSGDFRDEAISELGKAIDIAPAVLYELSVEYELSASGAPMDLVGRLLLKAHHKYLQRLQAVGKEGDKKTAMKNAGYMWLSLFDFAIWASACGHPEVAEQALERVARLRKAKVAGLSKAAADYMVAIEALALAVRGNSGAAYEKMLAHGKFGEFARSRILRRNPGRFAALFANPKKLSFILGLGEDSLVAPPEKMRAGVYVDLTGKVLPRVKSGE